MCGIVGLHLRDPDLYPQLGTLLETMLCQVIERGPDSAGVAVYGDRRRCPAGYAAVSVLTCDGDGDGDGSAPKDALAELLGDVVLTEAGDTLSLIHISEPTRLGMISYAVFCLK